MPRLLSCFLCCTTLLIVSCNDLANVGGTILQREQQLRKIALNDGESNKCSSSKIIVIKGPYGGAGNLFIILANALWLGSLMQAAFEIPRWAEKRIFHYFNLNVFYESFCTTKLSPPTTESNYTLLSGVEAYAIRRMYRDDRVKRYLPPLNEETFRDASRWYIRFYASLWSSPKKIIFRPSVITMQNYLGNSTNYISVHHRNFEGDCNLYFCRHFNISNLPVNEVPLHLESWKEAMRWERGQSYPRNCSSEYPKYPICDMTPTDIKETFKLLNKTLRNVHMHLGTDGQKESTHIEQKFHAFTTKNHTTTVLRDLGYAMLDVYLFIHSSLFIASPMSTFSGMACIVRQILDLPTVPIMNYTYDNSSIAERLLPGWFVGCDSVRETIRYFGRNQMFPYI